MQSIKSKFKSSKHPHDQAIDGLKYAWPALKLALTVFEKTLDGVPIPGLKGSIGGFLELANVAEVCADHSFGNAAHFLTEAQVSIQNSEDVLKLQKQIMTLTSIFTRWSGVRDLPLELRTRIESFFL